MPEAVAARPAPASSPLGARTTLGSAPTAGETSATTTKDGESTTMDYQDMRKARTRVDCETGK